MEVVVNESEALAHIFLEAQRKATEEFAPEEIHNEFFFFRHKKRKLLPSSETIRVSRRCLNLSVKCYIN